MQSKATRKPLKTILAASPDFSRLRDAKDLLETPADQAEALAMSDYPGPRLGMHIALARSIARREEIISHNQCARAT
jgi:hypothetical protein